MICQYCGSVFNGWLKVSRFISGRKYFSAGGAFNGRPPVNKDYYKVLGVSRDASAQQIKGAYYELSKLYHPDVQAANDRSNKEQAKIKFQEINDAYETLGNKAKRSSYDRYLRGESSASEFSRRDSSAHQEEDDVLRDLRRYDDIRKNYRYRGMDPRASDAFNEYYKFVRKKFDEDTKRQRMNEEPFNNPFNFKEYGRPFKEHEFTDFQREMIRRRQGEAQFMMARLIRNLFIFNIVVMLVLLLFF